MLSLFDFLLPQTSLKGETSVWFTPEELLALWGEKSIRRLEKEECELVGLAAIDRLVATTSYARAPLLRLALHRLKYQGVTAYIEPLQKMMLTLAPHLQVPMVDAVCAVPLHWSRRFWRGFNQSDFLAQALAHELGVPVVPLIRRRRSARPQVGLSPDERRVALRGAFVAAKVPSHVLIVDDVVTTGGTINACSEALRLAGASRVSAACLAYAG